MSRETYQALSNGGGTTEQRGFFGVACAYSGIPFAGYRIDCETQNYFKNARKSIQAIVPYLNQFQFITPSVSYEKVLQRIKNPRGLTIYCDPPYKDNRFHSTFFDGFEHRSFWKVMRQWSKFNLVIISEYSAPRDFVCIWEKEITSVFSGRTKNNTEKLFIHQNLLIR